MPQKPFKSGDDVTDLMNFKSGDDVTALMGQEEPELYVGPDVGPEEPGIIDTISNRIGQFSREHPKFKEFGTNLFFGTPEMRATSGQDLMKIPGTESIAEGIRNKGMNTGNWYGGFFGDIGAQIADMLGSGFDPRTAGVKANIKMPMEQLPVPKGAMDLRSIDLNADRTGLDKIIDKNHIQRDVVPYAPEEPVTMDRFNVTDNPAKDNYPLNVVPRRLHPDESNMFTRNVPQSIQDRTGQFGTTSKPEVGTRIIENEKRVLDPEMTRDLYERVKNIGVVDHEAATDVANATALVEKANEIAPISKTTRIAVKEPTPEAIARLTNQRYKIVGKGEDGTLIFEQSIKPKRVKPVKEKETFLKDTSGELRLDEMTGELRGLSEDMHSLLGGFIDKYGPDWMSAVHKWYDNKVGVAHEIAKTPPMIDSQMLEYYSDMYGDANAIGQFTKDYSNGMVGHFLPDSVRSNVVNRAEKLGFKYPSIEESMPKPSVDPLREQSDSIIDRFKELVTSEEGSLKISKDVNEKVKRVILDGLAKSSRININSIYDKVSSKIERKQFNKILSDMMESGEIAKAGEVTKLANQAVGRSPDITPESSARDSITRLVDAVRNAKPIREEQEVSYSMERGERIREAMKVRTKGEKGFHKQLTKLQGPLEKVDFEPIRNALSQVDIDSFMDVIQNSPALRDYEKIRTKVALGKMLGGFGGNVPQANEIALLEKVFGPEMKDAIEYLHGGIGGPVSWSRVKPLANEVANFTKAIQASIDLSAPLRQGLPLIYRKEYWPAFRDMFKFAASEQTFNDLMTQLETRPYADLGRAGGLRLTEIGTDVLTAREEQFASKIAEKYVPGVRASERAYVGFLDKLRADTFDSMVTKAVKAGYKAEEVAKPIANYVNVMTGRGGLGAAEKYASELNTLFFSPRLISSRVQMVFNPKIYTQLPKGQRLEGLKALFSLAVVAGTAATLNSLMGDKGVDYTNTTSSDWMKARVGKNTRVDVAGGMQQYLVELSKQLNGGSTSTISGKYTGFGSSYTAPTRWQELEGFGANKLSPIASLAYGILNQKKGKGGITTSVGGRPWDTSTEVMRRALPLMVQDIYELSQKEPDLANWQKIIIGAEGALGAGVQVYDERPTNMKGISSGLNSGIQ